MHKETPHDWLVRECAQAKTFAELAQVGLRELEKFGGHAEIVCGPITTGGLGTPELNLTVFSCVITSLSYDRSIFNQAPYEYKVDDLRNRWRAEDPARVGQYCEPILTEFYGPLFHSGVIKKGHFIPGWQSSKGAMWERVQMQELGIEVYDLPEAWIKHIMLNGH